MSVLVRDLRWYGSDVMPDDDVVEDIGGAIDLSKQIIFTNVNGLVQVVSDDAGDTETVTIHFKDVGLDMDSEGIALTGLTPAPYVAQVRRLLKAIKAGPTTGNVAIEAQTPERVGTAQAGDVEWIQLDAGASAVDGAYRSKVCRLTGGTGAGQIRRGVQYTGADQKFYPNRPFSPAPDASTTFRVADGIMFEVEPDECLEVRRLHYAPAAADDGGDDRVYYEKHFIKNLSADPLLTALVAENADPEDQFAFALEVEVDGVGVNIGNRQQAPGGVSAFSDIAKAVPGTDLLGGEAIGVWTQLSIPSGDASTESRLAIQISGDS